MVFEDFALAGDAAASHVHIGLNVCGRTACPQDYAKAAEWYQKAAQMGNGDAMNNLGCLYASGQGVAADAFKAREWYRKAAEAGSAEGSQNLKGLTSIDTSIQSADRLFRALLWVFLLPAATISFVATSGFR